MDDTISETFDMETVSALDRYKLLTGLVVPRPIAFVSTRSPEGRMNAAPFAFFNLFAADPPTVVVGINNRPSGRKDTDLNIHATCEFVVNIVSYEIAEAMNLCSIDSPPEIDEIAVSGLTPAASVKVLAPRILEAPASLECKMVHSLSVGPTRRLIVGEVLYVHTRAGVVEPGFRINSGRLDAVGRMGGGRFLRTADIFDMERPDTAAILQSLAAAGR